jgi:hypothetical protein
MYPLPPSLMSGSFNQHERGLPVEDLLSRQIAVHAHPVRARAERSATSSTFPAHHFGPSPCRLSAREESLCRTVLRCRGLGPRSSPSGGGEVKGHERRASAWRSGNVRSAGRGALIRLQVSPDSWGILNRATGEEASLPQGDRQASLPQRLYAFIHMSWSAICVAGVQWLYGWA